VLALVLVFNSVCLVEAATMVQCTNELEFSMDAVMSAEENTPIVGYLARLRHFTATPQPVHLLIEEVQQMARDARVELRGMCSAYDNFGVSNYENEMEFYVAAYDMCECAKFKGYTITEDDLCVPDENEAINMADQDSNLAVINHCREYADKKLDAFLDEIKPILLEQAVRTSMEPLVQRFRSLNERLVVLLKDYSLVVNNFFTFSHRLGDTITGEWD